MKKLIYLSLVFATALVLVFAMESCVDPVMGDFGPVFRPGPVPRYVLYKYGILDMDPDSSYMNIELKLELLRNAQNLKYSDYNNVLTLQFTGNSDTDDNISAYFDKWAKEDAPSDKVSSYSRGISNADIFVTQPSYKIEITRDAGVESWPPIARLHEYHVDDIFNPVTAEAKDIPPINPKGSIVPLAGNSGITFASHLISITHEVDDKTEVRGFMLTLMIYGYDRTESVLENCLPTFGSSESGWQCIYSPENPPTDTDLDYLIMDLGLKPGSEYPDGIFVYTLGGTSYADSTTAAILDTQNAPYYYEIDITKQLVGDLGWPDKLTLADFGLYRIPDPTDPAILSPQDIATDVTHELANEIDQTEEGADKEYQNLYMRFYGTPAAEKVISDYFGGPTWTLEAPNPDMPGILSFSRGIANVSFDTSYKPYYEIGVTKDPASRTGWPDQKTLKDYGLYGWFDKPDGAKRVTYLEDTSGDQKQLLIWFFGQDTTRAYMDSVFSTWYKDTEPDPENPSESVLRYTRGPTSVAFSTGTSPFYEIAVSRDTEGEYGWPTAAMMKDYGLPDLGSLPAGVDYSSDPENENHSAVWYKETPDEETGINTLDIMFFGNDDTKTALANYFAQKYWRPADPADYTDLPEFATVYTRGYATAIFTSQNPYFELEISNDSCVKTWPDSTTRATYGNGTGTTEWNSPAAAAGYIGAYTSYVEDPGTDTSNPPSLTIRFYWDRTASTATSSKDIKDYFFGDTWCSVAPITDPNDPDYDPSKVGPTATAFDYARGNTSATLDTSGAASCYYEITLTKDTERLPGWAPGVLGNYGNGTISEPTTKSPGYNSAYTTYVEDKTTDPLNPTVTIRFYWNQDPTTVKAALFGAGWCPVLPVSDPNDPDYDPNKIGTNATIFDYTRGNTQATLDTTDAGSNYYELTFTKDTERLPGWAPGVLGNYGSWTISEPTSSAFYNSAYTTYAEDKTTDPLNPTVTIRFYWNQDTTAVQTALFGAGWCPVPVVTDPSDPDYDLNKIGDNATIFDYTRGNTQATLDTTDAASRYYEITFAKDTSVQDGWPNSTLMTKYGLSAGDILYTKPGSANYTTYAEDTTTDPTNPSLNIRFYWNDTASSVEGQLFSGWTSMGQTDGCDEYSKSPAYAAFDATDAAYHYYEVTLSLDEYTAGWPTPTLRTKYGISDTAWNQPGFVTNPGYNEDTETDPANPSLTIRFKLANGYTESSIASSALFTGWYSDVPDPSDDPLIVNLFAFSRGAYVASVYKDDVYYYIDLSKDPTINEGWPDATTRSAYGIGDWSTAPSNATYITWDVDDTTDPASPTLTITFNGTTGTGSTTTQGAVTTYFNSWTAETPPTVAGTYEYSKGFISAVFDPTAQPFVLEISKESATSGWPAPATWSKYGLTVSSQPPSVSSPMYSDTADGLLVVFTGTGNSLNSLESTIKGYFSSWNADTTVSPFDYSKAQFNAEFTVGAKSGSGNTTTCTYTLEISIDGTAQTGWPAASVWTDLGLTNIAQPNGTGTNALTNIGYSIADDGSLIIWFNGSSGTGTATSETLTRNALKTFFNEETTASPYDYSRGPWEAEFTLFTGSGTTNRYFEIEISKDPNAVENAWPASAVLTSFGLGNASAPRPTGYTSMGYKSSDTGTPTNDITIWFIGATMTSVTNWLTTGNTWVLDTGTNYYNDSYSTLDLNIYSMGTNYIEIVIEK